MVLGDCHGDGERLRAALKRAGACVQAALQSGNAVHLPFWATRCPATTRRRRTASPSSSSTRATAQRASRRVRCTCSSAQRTWLLRFFPRGFEGELALLESATPSADDVDRMRGALQRPPPVPEAEEWAAYANALARAFDVSGLVLPATTTDDAAAAAARRAAVDPLHLLMLLKLEAMAATSYKGAYVSPEAPGLVRAVAGPMRRRTTNAVARRS